MTSEAISLATALERGNCSQKALANRVGVTPQAVALWVSKSVPPDRVIQVSAALGWSSTPHQFAPHIYPHPDDGLPVDRRSARAPLESGARP